MKYSLAETGVYSTDVPTGIDAGDYTVWYEVVDTDGTTVLYGPESVTATIAKAPLTVTANAKTITYGNAPANDGVSYSGFVNSETESVLGGTLAYGYDYAQYGNAGTYSITPSGLTSDNYDITFASGTLTVEPKEVGLSWADTSFAYDGSPHVPTATATGTVDGDSVGVTVTGAQTAVGAGYTATASALSGDKAGNYALPSANTCSFDITAAPADATTPPTATSTTYDGASHDLVTGGTATGGTMMYALGADATTAPTSGWSTSVPTATNAGTYYVWYYVEGDANHSDTAPACVTASIAQREVALSWANTSLTYNGQQQGPTATITNLCGSDACTVTVTGQQKDAGTHAATASGLSGADAANYKLPSSATQQFTIAPKQIDITWTGSAFTYNGTEQAPTATLSNVESGDTCTVSVSGGQTNASSTPYTATATLTGADAGNYTLATGADVHSFTINPKTIGLSWSNTSLTYTGTAQGPTATATGLIGGDSCNVTVSGQQTDAGSYTATAASLDNANYQLPASATTPFTIGKAALTVTANANAITYGDAPSGAGVTYNGFVGSDSETSNDLTGTLAYDFTYSQFGHVTDASHAYTITPKGLGSNNYDITYAAGVLTVNKREVALEWSSPAEFDYDGTLKTWDAPVVEGTVNGDALTAVWAAASAGSSSAYQATLAGTYRPTVSGLAGDNAENYALPADATGEWKIVAPGTNNVTVAIAGWTYGKYDAAANAPTATADFGTPTFTYSDAEDGAYTATVPTNAGTYWVKATVAATANYPGGEATCQFEIKKADITVTADNKVAVWNNDGTVVALTCTVAGDVVSGDEASLQALFEAAQDSANPVNPAKTGVYPLKAALKAGATSPANYNVTAYNPGTYTVTRALANVTSAGWNGRYDGTDTGKKISVTVSDGVSGKNFAGEDNAANVKIYYSESDFRTSLGLTEAEVAALQGDDVSADSFRNAWAALQSKLASCSENELTYKNAGTHTVHFMIVSDQVSPDVIFGSEDVVITKAPLVVAAGNKAVTYGDAAPAADDITLTYAGLVSADQDTDGAPKDGVVDSSALSLDFGGYAAGSDVGSYAITFSGLAAANYDIAYRAGTLTVAQLEAALEWPTPSELTYNGQVQTYGPPTVTNLVGGDSIAAVLASGTGSAKDVGSHVAMVESLSGAKAANYKLPTDAAKLHGPWSIMKAPLTITAADNEITYGDAPSGAGATFDGLLGDDDEASLTGSLSYSYSYSQYGNVGDYTITPAGLSSSNYDITFAAGKLTVNPRELTLTWPTPDSFDYTGSELTYGEPTLGNIVNSDDVAVGAYSGNTATDAGTHTAKVESLSGGKAGNYTLPDPATHDWKIAGAANWATVSLEGWTYGDTPNAPAADAKFGKDAATFAYATAEDGPWSEAVPTAAGTYWVRATVPAGGSYDGAEATAKFTVKKRPVTVTALPQVVKVGGAIDASLAKASIANLAAGDEFTAVTLAGTSTEKATDSGTITPSVAAVKDAAGADMSANYEITYVPGKLIVVGGSATENGKTIYILAEDVWMTVDEAAKLLAASDVDDQLIALCGAAAFDNATGEALPVAVADRGGLAAKAGDYPVTFKTNPEVTATVHVTDAAKPAADGGSAEKPATTRAASKAASPATGDAPLALTAGLLLASAIVAAAALMLARRQARRRGRHAR